jgi:hypothetical protein
MQNSEYLQVEILVNIYLCIRVLVILHNELLHKYEPGGALGKAVGGGAHPSGGAAWRRWRMLRAAAFNGGKVTPVTDDVNGVAL